MLIQNIILPKKWILENKVKAIRLIAGQDNMNLYQAFGGIEASDQANSLSDAHRLGGFILFFTVQRRSDSDRQGLYVHRC